jgi:hypothetical protein
MAQEVVIRDKNGNVVFRGTKQEAEEFRRNPDSSEKSDAAPVDIARNELRELERRMGSASPSTQNAMREKMAALKEKIKRLGSSSGLSGSEKKDADLEALAERMDGLRMRGDALTSRMDAAVAEVVKRDADETLEQKKARLRASREAMENTASYKNRNKPMSNKEFAEAMNKMGLGAEAKILNNPKRVL